MSSRGDIKLLRHKPLSLLIMWFILAAIFFVYLVNVNAYTLKSYKAQEKMMKLGQLKEQYNALAVDEANLRELKRIESGLIGLRMEKAQSVIYIENPSFAFAQK